MGKEALVVQRNVLFKDGEFQGFMPFEERDFISIILKNHFYYARGEELENNRDLQQIIPYVWIVNQKSKKVFLYKRGFNANKEAGEFREQRCMNKFSGGVGGHIDKDTEEGSSNPIEKAMARELMEEVVMTDYPVPKIVGYINDDADSIGKVHFGIVAIAETSGSVISRKSEGLSEGRFYSIDNIEKLFSDPENKVETWTVIGWPFIKGYLSAN